jgi:hypothetical protein
VHAAGANDLTVRPEDFDKLYQWARYPQGMPGKTSAPPPEPEMERVQEQQEQPGKPQEAESESEPSQGAFLHEGKRALWALGVASATEDLGHGQKQADLNARKHLRAMVASVNPTGAAGSEGDIHIVDRWVDPETGVCYSVAVLPLVATALLPAEAKALWDRFQPSP